MEKNSKLGSASVYGTEDDIESVIKRYNVHPAKSDFYVRTKTVFMEKVSSLIQNGDVVLDVGCSFGLVTCEIARLYEAKGMDYNIIGIDIHQKQIDNARLYARKEGVKKVEFHLCNAREIDRVGLRDISLAVSLYSFHHIPDSNNNIHAHKRDVLHKLYSISVDGASLVIGDITVPISYSDKERYAEEAMRWMEPRVREAGNVSEESRNMEENAALGVVHRQNEYPITMEEYLGLFQDTGWNLESKVMINPYSDAVLHCIKS